VAVASAGPYANPRQITTPVAHHSVFTGRMPFLAPNQSVKALKALPNIKILVLNKHTQNNTYQTTPKLYTTEFNN